MTLLALAASLPGQQPTDNGPKPTPEQPQIEPASDEARLAIAQFQYPKSLVCQVFAAEPKVANVVAIHRDFQGRLFACETFRQERGVEDNRNHAHWMKEELAAKTVQDRIDYIRKYVPDADRSYTRQDDRIRLLLDRDSDGIADRSTVFSDRYNAIEMGTGAGVLSYRNRVYYTCIPDLFQLQDTDGDGVADQRKSLHTGYGVRFAFRGHDLHGLIVGPDGRLYFSIGDRGYNVTQTVNDPTSGAVFRCELDGSRLEVLHTGLRNPQELAFDDFGNLFTGDNNSDSGDRARFTEILFGADSGWRMYYQYLEDRGPFNRERIWYPYDDQTPAYILPPIANISDGPSGLEYYPGTGFGDRFAGRFFLCDFRGQAANSGIRSFRHQPVGASWKLVDQDERPFWNMLITDLDFGSDGRLYVADWVFGWQGVNKGRIYTFHDPAHIDSDLVKEVETKLKAGMTEESNPALVALLGHPDRRLRQEAQFELANRGQRVLLEVTALNSSLPRLARVHALFGLGQMARRSNASGNQWQDTIAPQLLDDDDPQVVIAALKLLIDADQKLPLKVAQTLSHRNSRVRFQAAMMLGRVGSEQHLEALVTTIVDNADSDPTLRHGTIMGLVGIYQRDPTPQDSPILELINHSSGSVRLATCIAMRKILQARSVEIYPHKLAASNAVEKLLDDQDEAIVLEAARVLHDLPVNAKLEKLAALTNRMDRFVGNDALVRRILNANFRVGTQAGAEALATAALSSKLSEDRRLDALRYLSQWSDPPAQDAVLNDWRPLNRNRRNVADASNALNEAFSDLLEGEDVIAGAAITAAGKLNLTAIGPDLLRVAQSSTARNSMRVAALLSLDRLKEPGLEEVLVAMADQRDGLAAELQATVIQLLASRKPEATVPLIEAILESGSRQTRQSVIATMGTMTDRATSMILQRCLKRMTQGTFSDALRLDVLLAAEQRADSVFDELVNNYRSTRITDQQLTSRYVDSLMGGDKDRGSKVFFGKTEVSCVRCHKVGRQGGEVGPNLSSIGRLKDRKYILEAIVEPNKVIAEGFAQTKVLTIDGELLVGLVKEENDEQMVLLDADGKEIVVQQDDIEDTLPGESSMPVDLHKQLSAVEIRDLVEYLATRKAKTNAATGEHGEGGE